MDAQGITSIIGAVTGLGAMLFAGIIAFKQLPKIHEAVNTNYQKMQSDLDLVRLELKGVREEKSGLQDQRLADAQAREAPVQVAAQPVPATVTMTDVELAIHKAAPVIPPAHIEEKP